MLSFQQHHLDAFRIFLRFKPGEIDAGWESRRIPRDGMFTSLLHPFEYDCHMLAEDVVDAELDHASGVARYGYVVCQDGGCVEGVGVVFKQV